MSDVKRALIVGAGAVGQVYARHLQRAGLEVGLFVREKYAADARAGLLMYPLNERRGTTARLEADAVLTRIDEVAASRWDQVWLCTSSTALRAGTWLAELCEVLGEDTTLVGLQPGLESQSFLAERHPPERTVMGMIGFISYQAPLPGHDQPDPPGVAYWFPPLSPSPFSGPVERRDAVVAALRKGGCPAKVTADATLPAALGSAVLMPHLVALEACDWSLSGLSRSEHLKVASEGSRQAIEVVRREAGAKPPCLRYAVKPWVLRAILALGPHVVPLPLEDYLRYHFTKVGDQTRFMMERYVEIGRGLEAPVDRLEALLALLEPVGVETEAPSEAGAAV
ncbi:MAG: ketopantoate reductase family protein [Planctomycetota bacterium]